MTTVTTSLSAAAVERRPQLVLAAGIGLACAVPWSPVALNCATGALLALLLWLFWQQRQQWHSLLMPPLPNTVIALWAITAAAAVHSGQIDGSNRAVLQLVVLLGAGIWVGQRLTTAMWQRFACGLGLGLGANAAVAAAQLLWPPAAQRWLSAAYGAVGAPGFGPDLTEELTTGLFASHNHYAAFTVLALPLILAALPLRSSGHFRRWACLVALAVAVLAQTVFHVGFLLLLLAGPLLVVGLCTPQAGRRLAAAVTALLIISATLSWSPHADTAWQRLQPFANPPGQARHLKRLAIETAAAVAVMPEKPLGYGPGSYRNSIHRARITAQLPRPHEDRVRRNSNSQYIVLTVESGPLAMLAYIALLGSALLLALRTSIIAADATERTLAAGSAAALVILALTGVFTVVLVQALGVLAALIIGSCLTAAPAPATAAAARRMLLAQALAILAIAVLLPPLLGKVAVLPSLPAAAAGSGATTAPLTTVFIEAEQTLMHDQNFQVRSAFDTGDGQMLSIPEGSDRHHGAATYNIDIPVAGHYKLWLRVFWEGACSNSIEVQLDGERRFTVQDTIFNRWHWVDIAGEPLFQLPAGLVELKLYAVEDGVHIDQIALTDPRQQPVGILQKPTASPQQLPLPEFDDRDAVPVSDSFDKYGDDND